MLERGPVSPFYVESGKNRQRDKVGSKRATRINQVITDCHWPLLLHGGPGSGKSCIGLCLFDAFGGWYVELSELLAILTSIHEGKYWFNSVNGAQAYRSDVWNWWSRCSITILDEIGVRETTSDFAYETLHKCFDNRGDKPAVFISNKSPEELGRLYDGRILSRISQGTSLKVEGDQRPRKEQLNVK